MDTQNLSLLAGNYEIAIGDVVVPATLLGDINPNYEEGEITADTQAGTMTTPNGKADTSELTFSMFLPQQNAAYYLGQIFKDAYNEPTAEAQKTGNIIFSSGSCSTRTPVPVNIHNVCDKTDDNDIYMPAVLFKYSFNPTLSTSDVAQIEVTAYIQADANGDRLRFGTGDLSQPSKYDVTTQKTVPVTAA